MSLDRRICSRARLARDARFDGKFFIGVLTTKIYCRPICRSRTSKENNVRYFPSAAAAAEAGFRPCLRCRPECAPGCPAGTQNTVSRALRLISETGLEDGVESLAAHLGIGSRHLRRLFLRHLGATPSAVAQTRRLHFAKKLINETRLPMTQIAFAAGFGSVRRFNAAIRSAYHRTPTQVRGSIQKLQSQPENHYLFQLNFRPPYDWQGMLRFLADHEIPGVEVVEDGTFRRSIWVNEDHGYLEVSLDVNRNALDVRVQIGRPQPLFSIIERVRAIFDLDADWPVIARTLGVDPTLSADIRCHPGLRVPGCWDGFELAIRAILQQTGSEGRALTAKIVRTFGQAFCPVSSLTHLFPKPHSLANADLERIGVPRHEATGIRTLARAVRDGKVRFGKIADAKALLTQLSQIPGIGACCAQWILMRAAREPDAFPAADPNLAAALALDGPTNCERRSLAWRPWRAYAAMYLSAFRANIGRQPKTISTPIPPRRPPTSRT